MYQRALLFSALMAGVSAQQVGTQKPETHPPLAWKECTSSGCTSKDGSVVIDANWRWVHSVDGYKNCYTGNEWDSTLCPDDATCATNCAVDGADYAGTYGATTEGDSLSINFVTGSNIGSRFYLMEDENKYQMFKLLNKEFTFDVDVSTLPCGLNGALYFVSMDADGGMSKYETNKAGAKYGTGYCDSQCPRDLKFINGKGNVEGWKPSANDKNAGVGPHGSCCAEMDIWEANSISTALTPHPCDTNGQTICEGDSCGGTYSTTRYAGTCDPDGCDFNPFRMGNESFYGPGKMVDTKSKMTVVTQFITSDGTDTGSLKEIKRVYVQNGKVIANSASDVSGITGNSITSDFCTAQKKTFGDEDVFNKHGGLSGMGDALGEGMVLVMSLWDDHNSNMLWLDGEKYPTDAAASKAGVSRGTCSTDSGKPSTVESESGSAKVVFSNIKVGSIGSTFSA
ncbi:putative 1,4-beta-D-glucan cellobiohydrolase A [Penicillium oxalicum]|uniref:Glucanase n=3 Tax=Penicillium TaxID=5073 RepID=A3RG86_PENDC|nr:putative 1,4-beta-D-glucan cellobiohydrolase A [Penicillium oxalicum]ABN68954.1 exo-cellobiohydrolase [Penicillium decumbens]EPS30494.1 putative cellobiohydrolase [Penicillium oxalicum 114-2]ALO81608.1 cellobiohydrolase I [Penicillium oxalicum]ALO81609.1 cellobiohydrolase I [Penicillium oxalicum]KAI2792461.1 putative 1,4-beta-D-glucan cellobiohydrolase A [Penicillium oxalicum]